MFTINNLSRRNYSQPCWKPFPQIDCSGKFCKISGKTSDRVTPSLKRDSYANGLQENFLDLSEQQFHRTTWTTASSLFPKVTRSYVILHEGKTLKFAVLRERIPVVIEIFLTKQKEPSNKWSFIQKNMTRILAW